MVLGEAVRVDSQTEGISMAEPRVKWGQILVEKVDRLDQRLDQVDHRLDQVEHRIESLGHAVATLGQRMDRQEETTRVLIAEVKDVSQRSTNTAAVVRWSATVITITLPLLITGAAWLTWHTAGLSKQADLNAQAISQLRVETLAGFDRIEAALKAEAFQKTSD